MIYSRGFDSGRRQSHRGILSDSFTRPTWTKVAYAEAGQSGVGGNEHADFVQHVKYVRKWDMPREKQNVTISISPETVRKAKILAARRSTSISRLLSEQVEALVDSEEAYERAERSALALLDAGFHLGGLVAASRDELHER